MPFSSFCELYENDIKARLKLNTWLTKEHIIQKKILPYFKVKKMNDIKATDVMAWQNAMMNFCDDKGKGYSMTYLRRKPLKAIVLSKSPIPCVRKCRNISVTNTS